MLRLEEEKIKSGDEMQVHGMNRAKRRLEKRKERSGTRKRVGTRSRRDQTGWGEDRRGDDGLRGSREEKEEEKERWGESDRRQGS